MEEKDKWFLQMNSEGGKADDGHTWAQCLDENPTTCHSPQIDSLCCDRLRAQATR